MNSINQIKKMENLIYEISESASHISTMHENLKKTAEDLERKGNFYAKGYWRKQKYFLLYSSLKKGKPRVYSYVGCDPEKIRAAKEIIQRTEEYEAILEQMAFIEFVLEQCNFYLTNALRNLKHL